MDFQCSPQPSQAAMKLQHLSLQEDTETNRECRSPGHYRPGSGGEGCGRCSHGGRLPQEGWHGAQGRDVQERLHLPEPGGCLGEGRQQGCQGEWTKSTWTAGNSCLVSGKKMPNVGWVNLPEPGGCLGEGRQQGCQGEWTKSTWTAGNSCLVSGKKMPNVGWVMRKRSVGKSEGRIPGVEPGTSRIRSKNLKPLDQIRSCRWPPVGGWLAEFLTCGFLNFKSICSVVYDQLPQLQICSGNFVLSIPLFNLYG